MNGEDPSRFGPDAPRHQFSNPHSQHHNPQHQLPQMPSHPGVPYYNHPPGPHPANPDLLSPQSARPAYGPPSHGFSPSPFYPHPLAYNYPTFSHGHPQHSSHYRGPEIYSSHTPVVDTQAPTPHTCSSSQAQHHHRPLQDTEPPSCSHPPELYTEQPPEAFSQSDSDSLSAPVSVTSPAPDQPVSQHLPLLTSQSLKRRPLPTSLYLGCRLLRLLQKFPWLVQESGSFAAATSARLCQMAESGFLVTGETGI
ncbi:uncharacterized protein BJ171DRAFT_107246 [Polychytrium aggregatum]|uniref:uncharacterized protein n=1 Tax=Polychytrium aggregatum TaxID=110093 RepID=UPI0022FDBC91|nr:uncharacterized protein BJ171DRAFT_107246 [Polychytrium aggregatum]KAI9204479.1 hypothetical protein BJ171DRAFT_107246 [Polychytrium aggregatum]